MGHPIRHYPSATTSLCDTTIEAVVIDEINPLYVCGCVLLYAYAFSAKLYHFRTLHTLDAASLSE
jgi:hypothetical protein